MNILIKDVMLYGQSKDIYIENGTITCISSKCSFEADKIINGKGKAALPSLVNGHTHSAMTLFRGYADDIPLKEWLEEMIWPLEAKLTEEDVYWGAKLACLEMIKNGVTVFNDMYWHWEATAKAVCETGIRGFISAVLIDMFDTAKAQEQIENNIRLYEISEKYRPNVTFTLGPHSIYTVSRESLEWIRDFSQKNEILVHMHLSETAEEVSFSREKYGMSPVGFLDSIGLLTKRFLGCHGCWLDEEDCAVLRERGANLINNPASNLKLTVGSMFPYRNVIKMGIPFCFGTDGCASSNNLDVMESMKLASLLAKHVTGDTTMLSAWETFDMASSKAADIFRLGRWEITEGGSPDIMLVDLNKPELTPGFDIYSDMVYSANGHVVDTVICMGKVVMENRCVNGEEEIIQNAKRIAEDLVRR